MELLLVVLLSFIPMLVYAGILWWLDRYEKEPFGLLLAAFLWGCIPAIILAIILELILDVPISIISPAGIVYDLLGSALGAPFIEETTKGLALLLLLLFWRRELDGTLDGILYGGVVGFGFAAVENVLYLGSAFDEGGAGAALSLAVFRAGLFGLNHAMYTGFTGLGLALALESKKSPLRWLWPILGFAAGMGMHMFHNGLATFISYLGSNAPMLVLILGDWAGALALVIVIVISLGLERRRIRSWGAVYVHDGYITPQEVALLSSSFRRWGAALQLLLRLDFAGWRALGRYLWAATELAYAWHRVQRGDRVKVEDFTRYHERMLAHRAQALAHFTL